jgi:hypothetical protein
MGVPRMILINLDKAKIIVHEIRRQKRTAEFAPLDIKATIPMDASSAEAARQALREKYAAMQVKIDSALSITELKLIVDLLK